MKRTTTAAPDRDKRHQASTAKTAEAAAPRKHPNYAAWRAACLISVYALFTIHIIHWKLAGKTLAPLELHEVMYTTENGVITAGFILMALGTLSVLIFGRFFCSWGCHILALQDLCEWILRKLHIKPKPVRSRLLLLVPITVMLYMFAWPQIPRIVKAVWPQTTWSAVSALPEWKLRVLDDRSPENWASFTTTNFWRNLPTPVVVALTFLVCGFLIVYFVGTRGFCTYACPYGALFSLVDRAAPGKIMTVNPAACGECGTCTAACQSHIRVHEELSAFGRVVSPACMKDLDCVAACPEGNIKFGFTKPAGFKSWRKLGRFGVPYDFTLAEDLLMAVVFIATVAIFRGLYDFVPFLMTLGLGVIVAYGTIVFLRLCMWGGRNVRFSNLQLRRAGRLTAAGWGFAAFSVLFAAFSAHSAVIRYHEVQGREMAVDLTQQAHQNGGVQTQQLSAALAHLKFCDQWGLMHPPRLTEHLASLSMMTDSPQDAEPYVRRMLEIWPSSPDWRLRLAAIVLSRGEGGVDEAVEQLRLVIATTPADPKDSAAITLLHAAAHEMLGDIRAAQGAVPAAIAEYRQALVDNPNSAHAQAALAQLGVQPPGGTIAPISLRP